MILDMSRPIDNYKKVDFVCPGYLNNQYFTNMEYLKRFNELLFILTDMIVSVCVNYTMDSDHEHKSYIVS